MHIHTIYVTKIRIFNPVNTNIPFFAGLLGDVLVEKPNTDEYESRCVMVFGIPAVGSDRLPKLKNVLGKLFGLTNPDYHDHYPLDADGKTSV